MAASFLSRLNVVKQRVDYIIASFFGRGFPPAEFCIAGVNLDAPSRPPHKTLQLKDIIGDGFLWAVPRNRRTVEKRWKRKFGYPNQVLKLLLPKSTLRICNVCGDDHEAGVLCPTCYKRVIDETKLMQDAIQENLGLQPVEKEVVVLYDGEKPVEGEEYWKGKRIVEIAKPRPSWFGKNLLQQTTQQPSTSTEISTTSIDIVNKSK